MKFLSTCLIWSSLKLSDLYQPGCAQSSLREYKLHQPLHLHFLLSIFPEQEWWKNPDVLMRNILIFWFYFVARDDNCRMQRHLHIQKKSHTFSCALPCPGRSGSIALVLSHVTWKEIYFPNALKLCLRTSKHFD